MTPRAAELRRHTGGGAPRQRFARRLVVGGVAIGVVCLLVYGGIAVYGAGQIVKRPRTHPAVAPAAIAANWQDAAFVSRDDHVALRGWWFPGDGQRALILLHGRGQNRVDKDVQTDVMARAFRARGYSVLLFDLRAHGVSAGDTLSYGVREQNDVLGALDFVTGKGFLPGRIAMIGVSYGAAAMLMAAPAMPAVGALVSDSAYAAIWPVVARQIPKQQPLLALLQPGPGMKLAARLVYGVDLAKARPVDAVKRVPERPILFIHGLADDYVVPNNARQLRAASANPGSDLWLVPGAAHAKPFSRAPDEWLRRVSAFLDAHLSAGG